MPLITLIESRECSSQNVSTSLKNEIRIAKYEFENNFMDSASVELVNNISISSC